MGKFKVFILSGIVIVITFAATGLLIAGWGQQAGPATWSREEKEQFLLTAKIIKEKKAPGGITTSTRATLQSDRGLHDAHVQTINEYKIEFKSNLGTEYNFKDTYKFNLAAYLLDRLLDLNMIPVTVERKVKGYAASFTWWIDDILMSEKKRIEEKVRAPDTDRWNRQMYIVRVFDQLIANADRNLGNIIITKSWDLWMIDHTRAFRIYHDLKDGRNLVLCDRELLKELRGLNKQVLQEKLGKYLGELEINALLARRDKIVKFFEDKIALEGEAAVLYDYLSERRIRGN